MQGLGDYQLDIPLIGVRWIGIEYLIVRMIGFKRVRMIGYVDWNINSWN